MCESTTKRIEVRRPGVGSNAGPHFVGAQRVGPGEPAGTPPTPDPAPLLPARRAYPVAARMTRCIRLGSENVS